jgi:phosphoribosylformimino-5-aminoimidazole carboxamide ribotide isomerase
MTTKIQVIPAIDIIDGKCVRLSQGDYNAKKIYSHDPLDIAKTFEGAGLTRLHLVDLDGARARRLVNYKVLEQIANKTSLVIDFSGGIASDHDVHVATESGAHLLCVGSVAVKNAELFLSWMEICGPERIILAADVRDRTVVVSGWEEESQLSIFDLVTKYASRGLKTCMTTDVSRDGMLKGPAHELYQELVDRFDSLHWIASGGVSCIDDIYKLDEQGLHGVIIGKAIYEKKIALSELEVFGRC